MVRWSRQAQPCVRPQRLCGNTGSREDGNMRAEGERKGGKPAGKLDMGNEIDQAASSPPHVTQAAKQRALPGNSAEDVNVEYRWTRPHKVRVGRPKCMAPVVHSLTHTHSLTSKAQKCPTAARFRMKSRCCSEPPSMTLNSP